MDKYIICNVCHVSRATELHHVLIHRMRSKPELNHPYNLEPLCKSCHQNGKVNSYEHRREFYQQQVKKYGQDFIDWWNGLNLKVKPKFE
jgi:hypothetical protein